MFCIRKLPSDTNFEIKLVTMQMLTNIPFEGYAYDDLHEHFTNFLQVCNSAKYSGVNEDAIKLRLLKDRA